MALHVVVGAGPVGSHVARLLAAAGEQVRLVTRSGSGPTLPGVEHVAADAADAARLGAICAGAAALYNCASPAYHRWPTDWPPLAAAFLDAARDSGAVLATTGNLYGYGPVDGPLHQDLPLAATSRNGRVRARMWEQALAAHEAGQVRVTEVRASDHLDPAATSVAMRLVPAVLAGRRVRALGDLDAPHSFTGAVDTARLLVAVAADERAWGRPWHVPTNPPTTTRALVADLCRAAGVAPVPVSTVPGPVLRALGLVNPMLRAVAETLYQHERAFVLDDSRARATFGLEPTPWPDLLAAAVGTGDRQPRHSGG